MFVQIIEGKTKDAAGLKRQGDRWAEEVGPGAVGFLGVTAGVTADGRAITIARFESEEAAKANAAAARAERVVVGDGEVLRRRAHVHRVLRRAAVPRRRLERRRLRADHEVTGCRPCSDGQGSTRPFEKFASLRPDLIGGTRVWTGPDSLVEANYFTSEAEARANESKEMPEELQALMAEFGDLMQNTEFLDLSDPMLR